MLRAAGQLCGCASAQRQGLNVSPASSASCVVLLSQEVALHSLAGGCRPLWTGHMFEPMSADRLPLDPRQQGPSTPHEDVEGGWGAGGWGVRGALVAS